VAIAVAIVVVAIAALVRPDLPVEELAERYAGPPSAFVEVRGMEVHHRDVGDGPALLLLHGNLSSLHTWDGWVSELSDAGVRIITVDLPAHGLTGPDPEDRYRPDDQVAFVDALADALGLETLSIGGSSMGGGIAWRYALDHPERIDRLILVGSAGYPTGDGSPPALFRVFRWPVVGHLARVITPRFAVGRVLATAYADPDRLDDATIDRYWRLLRREGNRAATGPRMEQREEGADHERIPEIEAPTLILWGGHDTWIAPSDAERFHADLPDSELIVYDDLGHLPMEEDPVRTAADAADFLAPLR
jgi:pimeloyl-ACP methyl ester carboxylesterase